MNEKKSKIGGWFDKQNRKHNKQRGCDMNFGKVIEAYSAPILCWGKEF